MFAIFLRPDNKFVLSFLNVSVLSASSMIVWKWTRQAATTGVFVLAATVVYCRHGSMGVVYLPAFYNATSTSKYATNVFGS